MCAAENPLHESDGDKLSSHEINFFSRRIKIQESMIATRVMALLEYASKGCNDNSIRLLSREIRKYAMQLADKHQDNFQIGLSVIKDPRIDTLEEMVRNRLANGGGTVIKHWRKGKRTVKMMNRRLSKLNELYEDALGPNNSPF